MIKITVDCIMTKLFKVCKHWSFFDSSMCSKVNFYTYYVHPSTAFQKVSTWCNFKVLSSTRLHPHHLMTRKVLNVPMHAHQPSSRVQSSIAGKLLLQFKLVIRAISLCKVLLFLQVKFGHMKKFIRGKWCPVSCISLLPSASLSF